MKNRLKYWLKNLAMVLMIFLPSDLHAIPNSPQDTFISEAALSDVEKYVRNAAVKIHANDGHGSGSYVKMKGYHLVITARHVVDGKLGHVYRVSSPEKQDSVWGRLVWASDDLDMAVLLVPKISFRKPMKFNPGDGPAEIGTEIVYSGYPSSHALMSFRGRTTGYEQREGGKVMMVHTHGWFGCSGSVVYDTAGRVVGVLWGIDVGYIPNPQVIPNMLWVSPASSIDVDGVIDGICSSNIARPQSCEKRK